MNYFPYLKLNNPGNMFACNSEDDLNLKNRNIQLILKNQNVYF